MECDLFVGDNDNCQKKSMCRAAKLNHEFVPMYSRVCIDKTRRYKIGAEVSMEHGAMAAGLCHSNEWKFEFDGGE